jgi:hypothetical protein
VDPIVAEDLAALVVAILVVVGPEAIGKFLCKIL